MSAPNDHTPATCAADRRESGALVGVKTADHRAAEEELASEPGFQSKRSQQEFAGKPEAPGPSHAENRLPDVTPRLEPSQAGVQLGFHGRIPRAMSTSSNTITVDHDEVLERAGRVPHLIRVFQCQRPLGAPELYSLADIAEVVFTRGRPQQVVRRASGIERQLEVLLDDGRVSRSHARIIRDRGRFHIEDCGSKNGTRLGAHAVRYEELSDGAVVQLGHSFLLYREYEDSLETSQEQGGKGLPGVESLVPELGRRLRMLAKAAPSNVSVLILGETGTGKEVVARAIHEASARRGPFVAVNCGGIPRELVESEFFGVRRGAYSGATESRLGYVRAADQGTLFLDEIADLSPPAQAALLRVLQTREVVPVGEARATQVDFRVIAATNRDVAADVNAKRFRDDLFARIAGLVVTLPPLRERREDLGQLISALLSRYGAKENITVCEKAARAMLLYDWPLNVRELEKALETALVLSPERIELEHLPAAATQEGASRDLESPEDETTLRQRLESLLTHHQGNVSAIARVLGKDRVQIRRWLKRFNLEPTAFRRPK
jgi:DNA-binding NtrC family response regulator